MSERIAKLRCTERIQAHGGAPRRGPPQSGGAMRARSLLATLAALCVSTLMIRSVATAGGPIAQNCTVDPCLVLCPAGDLAFHVVVRRNSVVQNSTVVLYLCSSTGWAMCSDGQPADISFPFAPCDPVVLTGPDGVAKIALKAGGVTSDSTVLISADGVPLAQRFLASPDQNGDLVVNSADEAIFVTKLGTHDLSADFDGDGVVTEADHAILRAHLGHACEMPTAAPRSPWGEIKARYR
jgi:hypothetical protein